MQFRRMHFCVHAAIHACEITHKIALVSQNPVRIIIRNQLSFLFSKVFLQTSSALEKSAPIGMVLVPVGPYIAGSDKYNDERPSREIHLDAFVVDRFEVTQKQFKKIMSIRINRRQAH